MEGLGWAAVEAVLGCPGLGWHSDAEEVFVFRAAGSKEWAVRKKTVNPWPVAVAIPTDQLVERKVSPAPVCDLRPGDWLYVPGRALALHPDREEVAVTLSVRVMPPTALDVFDGFARTCWPTSAGGSSTCRPGPTWTS